MKMHRERAILVVLFALVMAIVLMGGCFGAFGQTPSEEEQLITLSVENVPSAEKIAFRGDSSFHYIGSDTICTINPDGTGLTALAEGDRPVWSPNRKKIAYIWRDGLYVTNSDGTGTTRVISPINVPSLQPSDGWWHFDWFDYHWSPDGTKIAFTVKAYSNDSGVYVVNADGTNLTKLVEGNSPGADFSPDGHEIAYLNQRTNVTYSYEYDYYLLYVMNPDGTAKRRLSGGEFYLPDNLRWSPDGSNIAFETEGLGGQTYYAWGTPMIVGPVSTIVSGGTSIIGVDSGNLTMFVDGGYEPAWSPDGKRIVYTTSDGLYVTNLDGTGNMQLATGIYAGHPCWSPDGERIVFSMEGLVYYDDTKGQGVYGSVIHVVNADGRGLSRVCDEYVLGAEPEWTPRPIVRAEPRLYSLTVGSDPADLMTTLIENLYEEGTRVSLKAKDLIQKSPGIRYVFEKWVDNGVPETEESVRVTMNSSHVMTAVYRLQYQLSVISAYGDPIAEPWHDAGDIAEFSVTSPVGLMIQQVFTCWSGDSTAITPSAIVLMDGPKTVFAKWRTDYSQLIITIATIVAVIVPISLVVRRRRRS